MESMQRLNPHNEGELRGLARNSDVESVGKKAADRQQVACNVIRSTDRYIENLHTPKLHVRYIQIYMCVYTYIHTWVVGKGLNGILSDLTIISEKVWGNGRKKSEGPFFKTIHLTIDGIFYHEIEFVYDLHIFKWFLYNKKIQKKTQTHAKEVWIEIHQWHGDT